MATSTPIKLLLQNPTETQKVLKKAISANRALAKLNGVAQIIPNPQILINSLALREAKDSSEIENIITIQKVLDQNDAGFRRQSKNCARKSVCYLIPCCPHTAVQSVNNLETEPASLQLCMSSQGTVSKVKIVTETPTSGCLLHLSP